ESLLDHKVDDCGSNLATCMTSDVLRVDRDHVVRNGIKSTSREPRRPKKTEPTDGTHTAPHSHIQLSRRDEPLWIKRGSNLMVSTEPLRLPWYDWCEIRVNVNME